MKKISILIMTLVFFLAPFGSAFASTSYEGGLLNGVSSDNGIVTLTDGDLTTYESMSTNNQEKIAWTFDNPVSIGKYILNANQTMVLTLYDSNGDLIANNVSLKNDYLINDFDTPYHNVSKVVISNPYISIFKIYEFDLIAAENPYKDFENLTFTKKYDSVSFSWDNPTDSIGTDIYRDNELIANLSATETSYEDSELNSETTYKYKFISIYSDGGKSTGIEKTITTEAEPPKPGITELEYNPSYYSVSFTWNNPTEELFSGVEVYRDGELISTTDTETSAFEDKNLTPETNYSYEFIAAYSDGRKGEVATIGVVTSAEPIPVFKSAGYEIDSTGNFIFKWTEPTTGDVKILIDGDEYTTAPAEPQQVTIPKEDIVTDSLGNPLVTLIPVTSYGTQGEPVEIEGQNVKIPFDVKGLLESGMGLLWIIGPFLLLALSFLLAPKLINLVSQAFKNNQ